eukprot:Pgem_evm1s1772
MTQMGLISNTKVFGCEFDNCFKSYSTVDSRRQHYKRHHHGQYLKGKKYAIGMRGKVAKGQYQIIESDFQSKIQQNIIQEAKQQQEQITFEEKLLLEEKKLIQMQEKEKKQMGMTRSASLNNCCITNATPTTLTRSTSLNNISLQNSPTLAKSLSLNHLNLNQSLSINTLPLFDFNSSINTLPLIDFNFMIKPQQSNQLNNSLDLNSLL